MTSFPVKSGTFTVTAKQAQRFTAIQLTANGPATLQILRPDGSELTSLAIASKGNLNLSTLDFTDLEPGDYTVNVQGPLVGTLLTADNHDAPPHTKGKP